MMFIDTEMLPDFEGLNVKILGNCFKNVSNSYKFYWFLSILDHVIENEDCFISLDEISVRMLSSVWYPLDYFKLSFGKQDGFKDLAVVVSSFLDVDNSNSAPSLYYQIEQKLPLEIKKKLKHKIKVALKRWVTFRFLTPFFANDLRGVRDQEANNIIERLSNSEDRHNFAPYRIIANGIILNDNWLKYFKMHQSILRGFIKWHLIKFLQKNNPNVVGLSEKLEKPGMRNLTIAKAFWTKFLNVSTSDCIFTGKNLPAFGFSLDHFIPWSYVAHDQLWNIIPTFKSINSSKSDKLPDLNRYLEAYCELQYCAVQYHLSCNNYRLLEDFITLFGNAELHKITKEEFYKSLTFEIKNSYRMAENLGFKVGYFHPINN